MTQASDIDPFYLNLGCIYKITSKTEGKVYIGQTELYKFKDGKPYFKGPEGRWSDHMSDARCMVQVGRLFLDAIREQGEENFTLEVLEICSLLELNKLEEKHIQDLGTSFPKGYNSPVSRTCPRISENEREIFEIPRTPEIESFYERIREILQYDIDHKFRGHISRLEGQLLTRVRIAVEKNSGAKRDDGVNPQYYCVTVFVQTEERPLAKNAIKFRFGGVTVPVEEAHRIALEFISNIPKDIIRDAVILDQVQYKAVKNR